jgi:hypothetical protein
MLTPSPATGHPLPGRGRSRQSALTWPRRLMDAAPAGVIAIYGALWSSRLALRHLAQPRAHGQLRRLRPAHPARHPPPVRPIMLGHRDIPATERRPETGLHI